MRLVEAKELTTDADLAQSLISGGARDPYVIFAMNEENDEGPKEGAIGLGRAYKNAVTAVGRPGLFLYSKAVRTSAAHKKLVAKNRERHAKWLGKELPPEPDSPGLLVAFFGLALIAAAL